MAFVIRRREIIAVAATAPAWGSGRRIRQRTAQAKTASTVYPVAVPTYEVQFVAQEKGYFKDKRATSSR